MTEQDLEYVEQMYASGDDPWRIGSGFYEQRKRQILLSCLPRPRYDHGFEPGCAAGELSVLLAERCNQLLAADVAARAVQLTAERLAGRSEARVQQLIVPQQWPADERFDLVVLSEFGYYLPPPAWEQLVARTSQSLTGDWTVLACHWRRPFPKRLMETEAMHAELGRQLPGRHVLTLVDEDFQLDVFAANSASVAEADGR
jgi:hypothetical protein